MSARRFTPQSKKAHPGSSSVSKTGPSSASKSRTPSHLNSTMLEPGSSGRPFRTGSAAKFRGHPNLDVTGIGRLSSVPNIKTSLSNFAPSVDYETECDLVYCDYLQALLKKEIVTSIIQKHKQDIQDQLAIQKDNLYKSKLALQKVNQELEELEKMEEVDALLNIVDKNIDKFKHLSEDFDLKNNLEQLLVLFNQFCNKVSVKNVKILETKEDFDELKMSLEKCVLACKKINLESRNVKEVGQLAEVMTKYLEKMELVELQQKGINDLQSQETYKLLKSLSDMYAEREKYNI